MIFFTEDAKLDIKEIIEWYENIRKKLSYDFEESLEFGIEKIFSNPDSFEKRYRHVKILFVKKFPYGIHYVTEEEKITVIGVFHTSRAPKNWIKRI